MPPGSFWRRAEDGVVVVSAEHLSVAARALHGAAWLGSTPGQPPAGLAARLRSQGAIRRAETTLQTAEAGAAPLRRQTLDWLHHVRSLGWTQADLLQVMEELEPHARAALRSYLTVRAGLEAADARMRPGSDALLVGLSGMPSVEAIAALGALRNGDGEARRRFLAEHGHRAHGDVRPDAQRGWDRLETLQLAAATPGRRALPDPDPALEQRWLAAGEPGERRAREAGLRSLQALCRAADVAWDAVAAVMAAAQAWVEAAAREAAAFGLISDPADVYLLELEELKQVATGEWHGGRRETVLVEIERRRRQQAAPLQDDVREAPISGDTGASRQYMPEPPKLPPPPRPQSILITRRPDAGWTEHWLHAAALSSTTHDACSPGMIVARVLGLPLV